MKVRQPKHVVIYQDVVNDIMAGKLAPGHSLPSESAMERHYRTSRTPVRQALRELEFDGYIYRLQGKGSFVSNHNPKGRWAQTTGFEHHYHAKGDRISAKTIDIAEVQHPEYARLLHIDEDTLLLRVTRVRTMDDEPVLFLKHFINPNVGVDLKAAKDAGDFASKDTFYAESAGIEVAEIEERLVAQAAGKEAGENLDIPETTPIIRILRHSSAIGIGPVDVTEYYVRTDRWDYITHYRNS